MAVNKTDEQLQKATAAFMQEIVRTNYSFNFSWLGRPVIQIPQDLFAMQEIIWTIKPDFIIETGIAHGGSLIFYASMLELIGKGNVIGIDIDIRQHNRVEIEKHRLYHRITMIEGSSVSPSVVDQVKSIAGGAKSILVVLDSNHTHEHVLRELKLYTPFVSVGSYCVVFDTGIEDLPKDMIIDRPWGPGNNPKTAVWEFLKTSDRFLIDKDIETKLLITAAPDGYLRCIK
ncbi:MAG TPA: cephalosporin hydroxylase [Proteobacteria bacterium]|nr:cephalosporin hydroxylase [Pseudomonadota bacterium]